MKLTDKAKRHIRHIKARGYTVRFVDYCEDHETPGFLGCFAGITLHDKREVKVSTRKRSQAHVEAILEHELEHVKGAERGTDHPHLGLKCGGCLSNFFGR